MSDLHDADFYFYAILWFIIWNLNNSINSIISVIEIEYNFQG